MPNLPAGVDLNLIDSTPLELQRVRSTPSLYGASHARKPRLPNQECELSAKRRSGNNDGDGNHSVKSIRCKMHEH